MNNSYYETIDKNFNEALRLMEKSFSYQELIIMLKDGNIPQKQLAALSLNELKSSEDAEILLNNLVGQDGKIREAVSLKIRELTAIPNYKKYFLSLEKEILTQYFLDAIIDINGNICRNILDTIIYFKHNEDFVNLFISKLIKLTNSLINKINDFDYKTGKYIVNKEVFKLYWCLEAINVYYDKIPSQELKNILLLLKTVEEYTIREKAAQILTHDYTDTEILAFKDELINDENYYVRRIFKS